MKKIRKIAPCILVIGLGIFIVLVKIYPEKIKGFVGYQFFVILTDSMEPVIPTGSVVLVKNIKDDENLNKNDIISFRVDRFGEEEVFTHYYRGTEVEEDGSIRYLTEAALADRYDDYVTHREDIIGTYLFHVPYIGKFVLFVKSPFALIELGIIMFIMIIYNILWDKFDKEEREAAEHEEAQKEEQKSICGS